MSLNPRGTNYVKFLTHRERLKDKKGIISNSLMKSISMSGENGTQLWARPIARLQHEIVDVNLYSAVKLNQAIK